MWYKSEAFHNHSPLILRRGRGNAVLADWQYIAIFVALAPIFPLAPVVFNRLLGPHRPNPIKQQTYECGIETVGDTWVQFKVQYYIYALVFVVFDVEAVFLFPIAAAFGQLDLFAIVATAVFIILLADGLVYAWGRGVLEWV
jgi:NADH-quinone oxidoreductase subunit A